MCSRNFAEAFEFERNRERTGLLDSPICRLKSNPTGTVQEYIMSILGWWRKRTQRRRGGSGSCRVLDEAGVSARVDLLRLEAFAEAAYEAMRDARPQYARRRYEEARGHFDRAIDAAQRARLHDEVVRLKRRREHIGQVYNGQMRYSGGG